MGEWLVFVCRQCRAHYIIPRINHLPACHIYMCAGLNRMKKEMDTYFLPTLIENAVAMAIQMSLDAINGLQEVCPLSQNETFHTHLLHCLHTHQLPGMPNDMPAIRWGGGCVTYIWRTCGFG